MIILLSVSISIDSLSTWKFHLRATFLYLAQVALDSDLAPETMAGSVIELRCDCKVRLLGPVSKFFLFEMSRVCLNCVLA